MRWTPEDILVANTAGPKRDRSWLTALVSTGQAHLPFLASIADEIEARKPNHVAAIFQLPFPIRLDTGWHRLNALEEQGLYADISFSLFELAYQDANNIALKPVASGSRPRWPIITQVAALVPIWGQRCRFHVKYLHHVERGTAGNPMIIPQKDSWHQNRPQFLGDYERLLAGSLARQVMTGLRNFLPAYAISSINEAPVPEQLYSYCAMTAPGRIVRTESSRPVMQAILQRSVRDLPLTHTFDDTKSAMQVRHRRFGRFEAQLFALERLCAEGETALALAGSFSLLEWAIKALLIGSGGKWTRSWLDIQAHPSLAILSQADWEVVHQIKDLRNRRVHEAPPTRQSITLPASTAGRQSDDFEGDDVAGSVRVALRLAFTIFREANQRGISIDEFKVAPRSARGAAPTVELSR